MVLEEVKSKIISCISDGVGHSGTYSGFSILLHSSLRLLPKHTPDSAQEELKTFIHCIVRLEFVIKIQTGIEPGQLATDSVPKFTDFRSRSRLTQRSSDFI